MELSISEKPIIVVGGIAGCGKSTLSNRLTYEAKLDHRLGLGWVREVVKEFISQEEEPALFSYSFRPLGRDMNPYENLMTQSMLLKPAIEACMKRAKREGTSLLLEGVNVIPGVLDPSLYTHAFYLKSAPDLEQYKQMIQGKTHSQRNITEEDIQSLRKMEAITLERIPDSDFKVIEFGTNDARLEEIFKSLPVSR